jgi:hypothetical protein
MRPFVEGLAELHDARLVYRTFTTGEELRELLSYQAIDNPEQGTIVYISSHGSGGRLVVGRDGRSANLGPIARSLKRGVEGIWIGSCDVGNSNALRNFLSESGAVWAGGYTCAVEWDGSLLVDLAVLQELLWSGPIRRRKKLVATVARALSRFDPKWVIGEAGTRRKVQLSAAIRVMARDKVRGSRPADMTAMLKSRLRWVADGVRLGRST